VVENAVEGMVVVASAEAVKDIVTIFNDRNYNC
jgi:hypothetical protein